MNTKIYPGSPFLKSYV